MLAKLTLFSPSSAFIHLSSKEVAFCSIRNSTQGANMRPKVAVKKRSQFDPQTFLSTIDDGRRIAMFSKKQTIFVQGDPSDAVFIYRKER